MRKWCVRLLGAVRVFLISLGHRWKRRYCCCGSTARRRIARSWLQDGTDWRNTRWRYTDPSSGKSIPELNIPCADHISTATSADDNCPDSRTSKYCTRRIYWGCMIRRACPGVIVRSRGTRPRSRWLHRGVRRIRCAK